MAQIELGDRVKDVVTGYQGVVIGITYWLTGCRTMGIQPPMKKGETKPPEQKWVDEVQLKVINKRVVKLQNAGDGDKGGPHDAPVRQMGPS